MGALSRSWTPESSPAGLAGDLRKRSSAQSRIRAQSSYRATCAGQSCARYYVCTVAGGGGGAQWGGFGGRGYLEGGA